MVVVPNYKLSNGYEIPILGFGTVGLKEDDFKQAIDIGYRHFDTAFAYRNEDQVGNAVRAKIAEGVIKREDVFIVTKLSNIHHDPERVETACRKSLENLGLDYIDLYLMHSPRAYKYVDEETPFPKDADGNPLLSDVDFVDTWKAMEPLIAKGLVRSLGVSNFNREQLEKLLKNCKIKPVNNQVKCNPQTNKKTLIAFCKENGISVVAWGPSGRPNFEEKTPAFHFDERTQSIAKKYNKSAQQVVLRYLVQIGAIPIPKSRTKERVIENLNIFDFELSDEDIKVLDSFHESDDMPMPPFGLRPRPPK